MPSKGENLYQLVYLIFDNEAFENSLFDLDTSDHSPEFNDPCENVSTRNENDITFSLDNNTKLVLVGNYSKVYRAVDSFTLDMIPMFNSNLSNLHGLREHITSYFSVLIASQCVVEWINVHQIKLFGMSKISLVFVHLKINDYTLQFKTHSIIIF